MIGSDEFFCSPQSAPAFGEITKSFSQTWSIIEQMPVALGNRVGYENAGLVYNFITPPSIDTPDDSGDTTDNPVTIPPTTNNSL